MTATTSASPEIAKTDARVVPLSTAARGAVKSANRRPEGSGDRTAHDALANALRVLAMDAVQAAGSGDPGLPMAMADVATVLVTRFLKFDPVLPDWPDRDRFLLSAGHGAVLQYALLHLAGYAELSIGDLRRHRRLGGKVGGHPERDLSVGLEITSGPHGQGLAHAVGMALAERLHNARFGDALVDHHCYVVVGADDLMEGVSHEAIDLAGHLRLAKLIVLYDDCGVSVDGAVSLASSTNQPARFRAAGWNVCQVDGHNPEAIAQVIEEARGSTRPSFIACKTIIGCGAPGKQGKAATFGKPLGTEEVAAARRHLGWQAPPFDIPQAVAEQWRLAAARGGRARQGWEQRLAKADTATRRSFAVSLRGDLPDALDDRLLDLKARFAKDAKALSSTRSTQAVLELLTDLLPNVIAGSASLPGATARRVGVRDGVAAVKADSFSGGQVHYGGRAHAMAAAMTGLALHGGFIPVGVTTLAASDHSRPALRLAAMMKQRVIQVMTRDSIGLGADGPAQQPVEQLVALRALPNLLLFRPADAVETAEAWDCALREGDAPSILALSDTATPPLRQRPVDANLVARGAYLLREPAGGRDVTLLASGSEVAIALEAAALLTAEGRRAAVVSMPCWALFQRQAPAYRRAVLGSVPRVGVEAALRDGWDRWLGESDAFVGLTGFGASGSGPDLYKHFGITPAAVAEAALKLIPQMESNT